MTDEIITQTEQTLNRECRQALNILREFNIEVRITGKYDREKIFEFREGQGNCAKGLIITNRVLLEKLGVDLTKLFKLDENHKDG